MVSFIGGEEFREVRSELQSIGDGLDMRSLPKSIAAGLFGIRRVKWAIQSWWRTGKFSSHGGRVPPDPA
jgi:hypothetical protein